MTSQKYSAVFYSDFEKGKAKNSFPKKIAIEKVVKKKKKLSPQQKRSAIPGNELHIGVVGYNR